MRSKVQIKGHPLHPMLIAFPIAFLCGSVVADFIGTLGDRSSFAVMGGYLNLAAIVTGLVAAVPGIIDYVLIVPPHSSAKVRATWHLAVNVTALAAFAISWAFRDTTTWQGGVGTLVLETAGVALVMAGGWLGGTLVYRNQIAVDHRYARSGKWREQHVDARPGAEIVVARADELQPDQMKLLHVGSRRIVLARTREGYVAFDDRCTHRGGTLADGTLACATVTCPWHGSQFDVRSGAVRAGPADAPIATYVVKQVGEEVRLTVPADASSNR